MSGQLSGPPSTSSVASGLEAVTWGIRGEPWRRFTLAGKDGSHRVIQSVQGSGQRPGSDLKTTIVLVRVGNLVSNYVGSGGIGMPNDRDSAAEPFQ